VGGIGDIEQRLLPQLFSGRVASAGLGTKPKTKTKTKTKLHSRCSKSTYPYKPTRYKVGSILSRQAYITPPGDSCSFSWLLKDLLTESVTEL
jgi:hypothetical protein